MRQFMISAAALTAFGMMLTTAQADAIHGAPIQKGNQCFTSRPDFTRDARWGFWSDCPQTASAAVAPAPRVRKHRSASH